MLIDKDLELSGKQVVTASAPSEKVIDTVVAGEAIPNEILNVLCVEAAVGGTVKVDLETSDVEDFSSKEVALSSKEFADGDLKAGNEVIKVRLPKGLKRYIRLMYTIGGTLTAGKFSAFINND